MNGTVSQTPSSRRMKLRLQFGGTFLDADFSPRIRTGGLRGSYR